MPDEPLIIGRYAVYDEIASGGMATVHLGRLVGAVGFSRLVAVKRLHPQLSNDPDFVAMFVDEARLAARIRHPNVVPTLDVVKTDRELFLVILALSWRAGDATDGRSGGVGPTGGSTDDPALGGPETVGRSLEPGTGGAGADATRAGPRADASGPATLSSSRPGQAEPPPAQGVFPEGASSTLPAPSARRPRPSPGPSPDASSSGTPPPAPPAANCDPPYTVDAEGIRHPKLECLH